MSSTSTHAPVTTVMHPLRSRLLTVTAIDDIGPRMRRVVLGGEDLEADFPAPPFAAPDHVKIVVPDPVTGEIPLPPIVDDRLGRTPGAEPIFRDYTVRRVDAEHLVLDFVLHDHGPAGRWVGAARVGDPLGVLGPRGSHLYPSDYERYVLVADETALPAVGRWLDEPDWDAEVTVLAVVGGVDEYPLAPRARSTVQWQVLPASERPAALAAAAALVADDTDAFLWAAGEADSLKPLRRALRERGVDRARYDIDGYWRRGVAGLDHHVADDD
ncbi:siderophore-interacting protein [Microbacterium horticulturae]|uniref:Siderophore-interacting protein n=1 Tax=Microbacterium horticulturae TaxID=3028316 RepID=A0ABY8BVN3_9MICO|nr:siderophore-interacting protein [Microbacterium sp. KACC 23027]WEG08243.1 siderophore-interacting protein [Microbacterium sp. KACC 23027]